MKASKVSFVRRSRFLPLTCITADHFTWTGNEGVSEESSLPEHLVSKVYRDACDVGFLIRSPRTDRVLLFTATRIERGPDNEHVAEVFRSGPYTVKIFND